VIAARPKLDPSLVSLALALACAVAGAALLVYEVAARPYGIVEAELLFEASRVQHHFALYVDPAMGAWEMGAPPSRYYVLYTPVWPWLLAHLSSSVDGMLAVGRATHVVLFPAMLAAVVWGSKPENRRATLVGALLAVGLDLLRRQVAVADPDVPAVALSAFGLLRMNRRGRLDATSATLLVLAPLVKPSVLGGAIGAFAAHAWVHRRAGARTLALPFLAAAAVGGALVAVFHAYSDGQWLRHIVRATAQTLSWDRWLEQFGTRAVFLGLPHAVVLAVAARRRASLLATIPLATSLAWAVFSMAKHGSATNYWLEPTMAALVAIGALPLAPEAPRRVRLLAWSGVVLSAAVAISTFPMFVETPQAYRQRRAWVEAVREACALGPGQVAVAGADVEMAIDGRVLVPSWQTAYLVRKGLFPVERWREDLERQEVACFVHDASFFDPPPPRIEGKTELSVFRKELHDVVERNFTVSRTIGSTLIFHRREPAGAVAP
jgi:hypothetical protein